MSYDYPLTDANPAQWSTPRQSQDLRARLDQRKSHKDHGSHDGRSVTQTELDCSSTTGGYSQHPGNDRPGYHPYQRTSSQHKVTKMLNVSVNSEIRELAGRLNRGLSAITIDEFHPDNQDLLAFSQLQPIASRLLDRLFNNSSDVSISALKALKRFMTVAAKGGNRELALSYIPALSDLESHYPDPHQGTQRERLSEITRLILDHTVSYLYTSRNLLTEKEKKLSHDISALCKQTNYACMNWMNPSNRAKFFSLEAIKAQHTKSWSGFKHYFKACPFEDFKHRSKQNDFFEANFIARMYWLLGAYHHDKAGFSKGKVIKEFEEAMVDLPPRMKKCPAIGKVFMYVGANILPVYLDEPDSNPLSHIQHLLGQLEVGAGQLFESQQVKDSFLSNILKVKAEYLLRQGQMTEAELIIQDIEAIDEHYGWNTTVTPMLRTRLSQMKADSSPDVSISEMREAIATTLDALLTYAGTNHKTQTETTSYNYPPEQWEQYMFQNALEHRQSGHYRQALDVLRDIEPRSHKVALNEAVCYRLWLESGILSIEEQKDCSERALNRLCDCLMNSQQEPSAGLSELVLLCTDLAENNLLDFDDYQEQLPDLLQGTISWKDASIKAEQYLYQGIAD